MECTLSQITYPMSPVQMRFLQLLSGHAHQTFTYQCKNSVAWYDRYSRNYEKSITFLGDNDFNDAVISHGDPSSPIVLEDGCSVSKV